MKMFFLCFLIFLSTSNLLLAENPSVILEDGKDHYKIGLNLDILEDPTGKLTIEDVINPEMAENFKRSKDEVPNFGFSKSAAKKFSTIAICRVRPGFNSAANVTMRCLPPFPSQMRIAL